MLEAAERDAAMTQVENNNNNRSMQAPPKKPTSQAIYPALQMAAVQQQQ